MRLLRIAIENYKCFQERTEIDFTGGRVEPGRCIFLIGGMNGAGKTAIMEAISICLYGEKKAVVRERINENQINAHDVRCSIELGLETDDHSELTVRRSWASHGLFPPPSADELVEDLSVIIDGKRTSGMSAERWAEYRDSLIPQAVAQFFFFDGERIQEMVAEEHWKRTLTDSMEAVLGIAVIRTLMDDLKQIIKKGREKRNYTSEKGVDFQKKQLEALKAKLDKKQEELEQAGTDVKEFQAEFEKLERAFSEKFSPDQKDPKKRDDFVRREAGLTSRLADIGKQIREFAEHILPLSLLHEHFPELRRQVELEQRTSRSAAVLVEAEALAGSIVEAAASPETVCCHEEMSKPAKDELRKRVLRVIRGLADEAKPQAKHRELLQLSAAETTRILDRLHEVERTDPAHLRTLLGEKARMAFELENVKEQIGRVSIVASDKQEFDRLQSEIKSYTAQLAKKREEESRCIDESQQIQREIEDQHRNLDAVCRELSAAKEHEAFIGQCQALIDLLTEYLEQLRRRKVTTLEGRTFEMYRRLASKGDLIKSVKIDPESYDIAITDVSGQVVAKHNLSAGEKVIFAISLLWGLAQTSELKLPVVIDTPLSKLDSKHRDRIVSDYFPHAADQVVVLSTDTEVDKQYFSKLGPHLQSSIRLQFDKTRKLSTAEKGYFWE